MKRVRMAPRWAIHCIDMLKSLSIKWSLLLPARSMIDEDDLFQEACVVADRITPKWRGNRKRSYKSFIWFVTNRRLMALVQSEWTKSALEFVELEQYELESLDCPIDKRIMVKEALNKMSEVSKPFADFILNGDGVPKEILLMAEKSRRIRAGKTLKNARMIFQNFMFEYYFDIDLELFQSILDEYV